MSRSPGHRLGHTIPLNSAADSAGGSPTARRRAPGDGPSSAARARASARLARAQSRRPATTHMSANACQHCRLVASSLSRGCDARNISSPQWFANPHTKQIVKVCTGDILAVTRLRRRSAVQKWLTCGARMVPARALPEPFWFHGLRPPPRTSRRVFVLCVPCAGGASQLCDPVPCRG